MKIVRYRPRLQTVLLLVNLVVLLLPLGGISVLHLYESELVKQTEAALIGQGALLTAMYRQEILEQIQTDDSGKALDPKSYGKPVMPKWRIMIDQPYSPIRPKLDMAEEFIRAPAENGVEPSSKPDRFALAAGEALKEIVLSGKRTTLSGIRLVDSQGIVVASSGSELGLSLTVREEVSRALEGERVSLLRKRISDEPAPTLKSLSRRAWVRVFVCMPVIEDDRVLGAVVLSRSPIGIGKALYLIRSHLIKAGCVLFLVVVFVSLLTTWAIGQPIKALIRQADNVSQGEKGAIAPLDSPRTQEVAQLSSAIVRMASTLEDRADYIRTFAGNVSHEFKTPLTSLRGIVEIFQDHIQGMNPDEKDRFLKIMEMDIGRLDRLVRRLLELARADVFTPGEEQCQVKEVLSGLATQYKETGKHVSVNCSKGVDRVKMERETLESIISNMVENALQHGGAGTSVSIDAASSRSATKEALEILITDNGEGISEANAEKIFRPFFTTARESGGSGLGLTIVKALLDAHGATIEQIPSKKGTIFKIVLDRKHGGSAFS